MALPELPFEVPTLGAVFPPTWVVIDCGDASDKTVSEAIVSYLMSKFPPVLAVRREVLPEDEPDPLDLMAHGVIIVGGPAVWWAGKSHWHMKYLGAMDPGWVNKGTDAAPIWWIVQKAPTAYETNAQLAALISSVTGQFPWLTVFNVAGEIFTATVQAGELFCAGETKGVWINKVKVGV